MASCNAWSKYKMKIIDVLDNEKFLNVIDCNYREGEKYSFHLQTWQDGDSFLDICDNDGGIKPEQLALFNDRNRNHVILTKCDLLKLATEYIKNRSFASKNEVYKLGYEILVSCKNDYFVLCPELNIGYYGRLNFINRFIGFFNYKEPWQSKKFGYWEKQEGKIKMFIQE